MAFLTNTESRIPHHIPFSMYAHIVCILAAFSLCTPLLAQQSGGGYAESWLFREQCTRPIGLGGTFTAIANDPSAIYYNPAGLSNLNFEPSVVTSVSMLGLGRTSSVLAWGQQVYENLGLGFAFNSLYNGAFTARDINGKDIGNYSNFLYAISGAASYKIGYASFGVNAKYLTNNLEGSEIFANGYTVDFGAMFDVLDMFNFGLVLQNASGMMFWNTVNSDLMTIPWKLKAGIATRFGLNAGVYTDRNTATGEIVTETVEATRFILLSLEAAYTQFSVSPTVSIATEIGAHELISFRGGIAIYGDKWAKPQFFPMTHWGAGLSIYPRLDAVFEDIPFSASIDYSISNELLSQSGVSHNISLTFDF